MKHLYNLYIAKSGEIFGLNDCYFEGKLIFTVKCVKDSKVLMILKNVFTCIKLGLAKVKIR